MTVGTIAKPVTTKAFPGAATAAKLRDLLLEAVMSHAQLKGYTLPADIAGKCGAAVHLDSLCVVDLLCGVESVVGFELKDSLVKTGGYRSINDAIEHLMPHIEKARTKNNSTGGKNE